MSHGVGCGSEIPSSYTNVAGSMCWIDWVMSTVPLSQYNVDDFEVNKTKSILDAITIIMF